MGDELKEIRDATSDEMEVKDATADELELEENAVGASGATGEASEQCFEEKCKEEKCIEEKCNEPEKKNLTDYEVRETIKTSKMFRISPLAKGDIDTANRRVNLTFSSETPVPREFGNEILDHNPASVRLDRILRGGALLVDHDTKDLVGKIETIQIGADKRGHASVRFGNSVRAKEVWQDVVDEIRTNVSVGYVIHDMLPEDEKDPSKGMRIVDWEPLEISLVAIPADSSVGVGRTEEKIFMTRVFQPIQKLTPTIEIVERKEFTMDEREKTLKDERERVDAISKIGEKHNMKDLATEYIQAGKTVEEFRTVVLEKMSGPVKPIDTSPLIGLTDNEAGKFSFVRAIRACADGNLSLAPFEKECSDAHAKKFGSRHTGLGFYVPQDVLAKRTLTKAAPTGGGDLIMTELLTSNFIEFLYNKMLIKTLGAQILGGLVNDIAIPKQTGKATAYWVAEGVAPTTSQQTFGQVPLTPKTVGTFTDISRKLLLQASLDVEAFVRNDLATTMALEIDRVCINGGLAGGEPTGILNWATIGSVLSGGTIELDDIIDLEAEVEVANALFGNLNYITTPQLKGQLKAKPKIGTTFPIFVWEGKEMNGYPAWATNQVPSNLPAGGGALHACIFGDFNSLIIGQWAGLWVLIDPYTLGSAGSVRVIVLQDIDVAIRHAGKFAAITDAVV